MRVELLQGDARAVLKGLPDASVQMVVTSPPYWGLRDYGIPPSLWGGNPNCEHEMGDTVVLNATNHTSKARWNHTRNGRDELQPPEKRVSWLRTEVKQGQFCQKCGAWAGALGLEPTPKLFVEHVVEVFEEVRRVLRSDGVCFINFGDSYCSGGRSTWRSGVSDNKGHDIQNELSRPPQPDDLKPKDLVGIPWRVAFALQDAGWWLRQDIIWSKPNPMPESVTDRCTKSHEYVFLLTKSETYYFDNEAIKEPSVTGDGRRPYGSEGAWSVDGRSEEQRHGGKPRTAGNKSHKYVTAYEGSETEEHRTKAGLMKVADVPWSSRNRRSVWTIATSPTPEAHFATFPPALVDLCVRAGTSERGCCPHCAAPWERVVDPHLVPTGKAARTGVIDERDAIADKNDQGSNRQKDGHIPGWRRQDTTLGWRQTCSCPPAEPVPCTVLDCFAGAFTSGVVANRLGRDFVGIELNPTYVEIGRRRIVADGGMFVAPVVQQVGVPQTHGDVQEDAQPAFAFPSS